MKEIYDLVFSLGGSCYTAMKIRAAGLGNISLPFDWLFYEDTDIFSTLKICFEEDFSQWLLKKNMEELKGEEKGDSYIFQYKDTYTKFRFIHEYHCSIEAPKYHEAIQEKYQRRIKRLLQFINRSRKIMMIIDFRKPLPQEEAEFFLDFMNKKFPGKQFKLVILEFLADKQGTLSLANESLVIHKISRSLKASDFSFELGNSPEWQFLRNTSLSWYAKLCMQKTWTKYFQFYITKKSRWIPICLNFMFFIDRTPIFDISILFLRIALGRPENTRFHKNI